MEMLKRYGPIILKIIGLIITFMAGREQVVASIPNAEPSFVVGGQSIWTILGLAFGPGLLALGEKLTGKVTSADPMSTSLVIDTPEVHFECILSEEAAKDIKGLELVGQAMDHYTKTPTTKTVKEDEPAPVVAKKGA